MRVNSSRIETNETFHVFIDVLRNFIAVRAHTALNALVYGLANRHEIKLTGAVPGCAGCILVEQELM